MTVAELEREFEATEQDFQMKDGATFQQLLLTDLGSLDRLQRNEQGWVKLLRSGSVTFNFEFDRSITQRYAKWVKNAAIRLKQLALQEEKGCCPESADEFRARYAEAQEILAQCLRDERFARERADLVRENGDQ